MLSLNLMHFLLCEYFVLMCVAIFEQKNILALYWLGAFILNAAVLVGMK